MNQPVLAAVHPVFFVRFPVGERGDLDFTTSIKTG